jgi:phage recombination protein Bet
MSSNALTVVPQFSQEQVDIIKSQVAPKGTTNDELAMFLQYCQRTGLDPFARQIYLSERRSQVNGQWVVTRKPETTIDGFRVIAERAGKYAGQLGPEWCGQDGQWKDVWTAQEPPIAARVGILRHDFTAPLWAVALYDEYVQTAGQGNEKRPNSMWSKMPANQLAKCAESLALRRAFPRELSGLYTKEELPSEQHEAKEAQKAILSEHGLTPYVAPAKSDVRTASEQHKALIVETAKMLDEPPQTNLGIDAAHLPVQAERTVKSPITSIEMRHAATVAETDAVLKQVAKPPTKKRAPITADSIEIRKGMTNMKEMLRTATGDDSVYYQTLKAYGYESSKDIETRDKGREIYKNMGMLHKRIIEEKKLRAEMELAESVYGGKFKGLLGYHGCESIDDVLNLSSEPLEALRHDLKALGGAA